MNAASMIGAIAIPAGIVGALTFFLMAVFSQESKTLSRTTLVRSAFIHVIAFVSLAMLVGSVMYLGQEALRVTVFKKAQTPYSYSAQPPTLYLSNAKLNTPDAMVALKCDSACELTDSDKSQIATWKDAYTNWQKSNQGAWSVERKRGLVDALSMFIVGTGLFIWFFIFIAQRENRRLRPMLGKPIALRTVYYYLVALVSLLAAIITATLLVNIALKSVFGLQSTPNTSTPAMVSPGTAEKASVQSIIDCRQKCGISTDDQALAKQWIVDYDAWWKKSYNPRTSDAQSDLANFLPIFIITAPLFWYHFARIRREGHDEVAPSTPTQTV